MLLLLQDNPAFPNYDCITHRDMLYKVRIKQVTRRFCTVATDIVLQMPPMHVMQERQDELSVLLQQGKIYSAGHIGDRSTQVVGLRTDLFTPSFSKNSVMLVIGTSIADFPLLTINRLPELKTDAS